MLRHCMNSVCNGRCDYGLLFHRASETQDQNPIRNGTESHATAQLHPCEGEAEYVHINSIIHWEILKQARKHTTLRKQYIDGV